MADRHVDQQQNTEPQINSPSSKDDMTAYVTALEVALLPCLPARELQAIDRSAHPYHQNESFQDKYSDKSEASNKKYAKHPRGGLNKVGDSRYSWNIRGALDLVQTLTS
ncbi:hypothetical protein RND71_023482 [Anisodus tanguticus]|uniref:Uncharacterized protein n=1 Tax=Anisodus tanguticus TaxID=243964 RepID=A0AAE1RVL9_9SOLA|nr:hypothetical protein RND71_023482 [Anisodus tanguticus]